MTGPVPVVTYSVTDVAAMLGCHHNFVRARVKDGLVRPVRLGARGALRFRQSDVDVLLDALTVRGGVRQRRHRRA